MPKFDIIRGKNKETRSDICFSSLWYGKPSELTELVYYPGTIKDLDREAFVHDLKGMGFRFEPHGKGFSVAHDGSFTEVLGTLSALRYLEEEQQISKKYFQIIKEIPDIDRWQALQLSHKLVTMVNSNHTIIFPGTMVRYTTWEVVQQRLKKLPLWSPKGSDPYNNRNVHGTYGTYGSTVLVKDKTIKEIHEELLK